MPSLAAAQAANENLALENTIAIVVGGTSGIGAALAVKIAQYSKNPAVHIVGRNETAAQDVIAEMKSVNPDGKYEFRKCDASLLSQVRVFNAAGRTETPEGNDIKLMLHYYSRYLFIRDLEPSLSAAGNAKIITVLNASRGNKKKINWDDLDLKKKCNYSFDAATNHAMVMNDIAIQRLASQNPTISYTHAYPGFVSTNIFSGLVPGFLTAPSKWLMNVIAMSSSDCAEWLFYAMQNGEAGKPHYVDNRGEPVKGKVLADDEEMEKLWRHTDGIVDVDA